MSERPTAKNTPALIEAAARRVADDLVASRHFEARERNDVAHDIAKHARPHIDGYVLASQLEQFCGWMPDDEMVGILGMLSFEIMQAEEESQREWAARENIVPPLPIGERVKLVKSRKAETGVISGVCENGTATYLISIDGDPMASAPTHARRIVNFEDIELL
ncbi:hypothetical protein [Photobacterium phosphoreum]|uniref:hypothetical protein n=1 Tax=Photobacterium phosphoreum TaxID=659 RepID=UPI0024B84478|nr:hypothetical protein [Photobacterium phosphoreum]